MTTTVLRAGLIVWAIVLGLGCRETDGRSGDDDTGSGTGGDTEVDAGGVGLLHGTVMAPSGAFPISGAIVYVTKGEGAEIPYGPFCYICDDMVGMTWALSGPDGSFTLTDVPAGTWNLVTRKGAFQRVREIQVFGEGIEQEIPVEYTTLPRDNSWDESDRITNYAVLFNYFDRSEDLLAKLGLGELDTDGHLALGTETFQAFNDNVYFDGYSESEILFTNPDLLDSFHMIFFPCACNVLDPDTVTQPKVQILRDFVDAGGKLYSSCWASKWAEVPFPEYIDFHLDDNVWPIGGVDSYNTLGTIQDQELADWLSVVAPDHPNDSFPFVGAWIAIDTVVDVDDGQGLEKNDFWVKPKTWVSDNDTYADSPMTVTYDWGCGRVFYSVYQVVESPPSIDLRPQELVLLYIILEVGVCQGDLDPPV